MNENEKKIKTYKYKSEFPIYGFAFSQRKDLPIRFGIGSLLEQYTNTIEIIQFNENKFEKIGSFEHPYPPTKLKFIPDTNSSPDLLAVTGDYLRLYQNGKKGFELKSCLNTVNKIKNKKE
jgi:DDB1- and CUL4-associated factor 7